MLSYYVPDVALASDLTDRFEGGIKVTEARKWVSTFLIDEERNYALQQFKWIQVDGRKLYSSDIP